MSITSLLGSTCVITRRTAGTVLDDDGNAVSTTTTGTVACSLQQIRRDEPYDQGEFSSTLWTLFLPVDTAIDTSDKVTVNGVEYEVFGDAWNAKEGSSAVHHVEATVKRTG